MTKICDIPRIYWDIPHLDQFNQHFTTIGSTLASAINYTYDDPTKYIRNSPANSFYLSAITEEYVAQLFSKLNERKASLDIPNKLIKLASHELSKPFSYIYNQSLLQGIVPNVLKVSRITPIFKSGDATDPANYTPIAVLSPFGKVLEKIVNDQLISFIDKYNILFKYQFGFRKDHSTELAVLEITDILKTSVDNNLITCGVFLDFSKAFDTVNHEILLRKLHKYGIRGKALDWFTSYFTNRTQYVKLGNVESSFLQIVCGVPQGSTLGPLLFLLYINDLANSSDVLSFRLFADDANIFYATKTSKDLEAVMNSELQKVINYCSLNKLSVNMKKTNFMIITSPQKPAIHNINILNIERKTSIKYLGIYLDEHLNWKTHIAHVQGKLTKNLGILNQLRNYLNLKMLRQLYYTLIYPYLNYGAMCWGNTYQTNLNKICTKQNKCIRSIFFAKKQEPSLPYYQILEILKLENIVKFKICSLAFKLYNNPSTVPAIFHNFLTPTSTVHSYNTRNSAKLNFYRPQVRTNIGKFTFKYSASVMWEAVPLAIKKANTLKEFKKLYKAHLIACQPGDICSV